MRTSKKELLEISSYLSRYGKEKPLSDYPADIYLARQGIDWNDVF